MLASFGLNKVTLYSVEDSPISIVHELCLSDDKQIMNGSLSNDGKLLVIYFLGLNGHQILLYDVPQQKYLSGSYDPCKDSLPNDPQSFIFSYDKEIMVITSERCHPQLFIWNITRGTFIKINNDKDYSYPIVKFSPWEKAFYFLNRSGSESAFLLQKYSYEGLLLAEINYRDYVSNLGINVCNDLTFLADGSVILGFNLPETSENVRNFLLLEFTDDLKSSKINTKITFDSGNHFLLFIFDGMRLAIENGFSNYHVHDLITKKREIFDPEQFLSDKHNKHIWSTSLLYASTRKYVIIKNLNSNYIDNLTFLSPQKEHCRDVLGHVAFSLAENHRYQFLVHQTLKILMKVHMLQSISRQYSSHLPKDLLPIVITELLIEGTKFKEDDSDVGKTTSFLNKYTQARSIGASKENFVERLYQELNK